MSTQIDRYAVMGNPVAHSQSPLIHQLFAEQTQQAIHYEKILVPLDGFTEAVTKFFAEDGKGLNITLPFKHQALTLADEANDTAKISGAANTLSINTAGKIIANNTDGIGLVNDLKHHCHIEILKQRILLIGAGGAARNVIAALFAENPAQLHIANRSEHKSQQLRQHFASLGEISASGLDNIG
ncbi:MAG: shikimate dehydrogenase [Gammaproteobacteria bacterium]